MGLAKLLGVGPGVTSVIGSGGKTSLLAALATELPGTVALATTTHFLPFEGVPLLVGAGPDEVASALARSRVVCVGSRAGGERSGGGEKDAKLAAPACGIEALARVADHVLVEADGAHRLPLKAHAAWEPVVPACSGRTVLVMGASGLGRPVRVVVHRPEVFCALAGCAPDDAATPERVARVARAEALADVALVNQVDAAPGPARELAVLLGMPAVAGSLRAGAFSAV